MDDQTILSDDRFLKGLLDFIPREQLRSVSDEEREASGLRNALLASGGRKRIREEEGEQEAESAKNQSSHVPPLNHKKEKFKLSKTNEVVIAQMFPSESSSTSGVAAPSAAHNVVELKQRLAEKQRQNSRATSTTSNTPNGHDVGNRKRSSSTSSSSIVDAPSDESSAKRPRVATTGESTTTSASTTNPLDRMQFTVKDSSARPALAANSSVSSSSTGSNGPLTTKSISNIKKLIRQAESKKARLDRMKKDASMKEEVEKVTLERLENKAAGEKLRDDPKLLKKTLKRLEHRKRKSASEWKERKRNEERAKAERAAERETNIRERSLFASSSSSSTPTPSTSGSARRPGFEGRIGGALNSTTRKDGHHKHHKSFPKKE